MSPKLALAKKLVAEIQAKAAAEREARGEPRIRVYSMKQLDELEDEPSHFEFDEELKVYRIYWGGYDYEVDLDELRTPIDLLHWLVHLGHKDWELMSSYQVAEWVEAVANRRGWDVHQRTVLPPRRNSDTDERGKLDRQLRWKVFTRDGFRCRACGNSAATGGILHVDHVQPVSKGGRTVFDNLQTLCSACNLGKGAE